MSKKNKAKTPRTKKPAPKAAKPKKVLKKPLGPAKAAGKKSASAARKAVAPKKASVVKTAKATPAPKSAKPSKVVKPAKPAKAARPATIISAPKAPPAPPVAPAPPPPPPPTVRAPDPVFVGEAPKRPVNKNIGKVSIAYEAPIRPDTPPARRDAPEGTGSTVKKGNAIFYDSHMHTPLCKHAWGEPEEYAEQGLRAGLKGIIFTCHCPMPNGFWPTVRMDESEFDTYVAMVKRTTDKFKGKLDVWLGLESEYYPGQEKYIEELHQRADYHFIIGGVHWQAKEYLAKFENGTIEGFRRTYFNHLADSAESGLYDCLAHPDLVKNYHPDSWCFPILKDHVAKVLDRIAATGVAMELNTSGLNKSYAEMNPGNEMLGMMADRKIPIVLGSDAHRAPRVGEHFIRALENLKTVGYKEVNYFEWRKRKALKIDDVLASLKKHEAAKAG